MQGVQWQQRINLVASSDDASSHVSYVLVELAMWMELLEIRPIGGPDERAQQPARLKSLLLADFSSPPKWMILNFSPLLLGCLLLNAVRRFNVLL